MQKIMLARACAFLTIGAGVVFAANGANEWSYADGKITKGDWSIVATYDASGAANAITLGAIESVAADGILDLRDMTVGGAAITALTLPKSSAWQSAAVVEFYVNHVANTSLDELFGTAGEWPTGGNSTITRVEVQSDTVTYLGNFIAGCSSLKHLRLDCPNLDSYGYNPFYKIGLTNDIQDIIRPWATFKNSNNQGYTFTYGGLGGMTGSLILTNVVSWGNVSFKAGVTNVWIRWDGTTYPSLSFPNVKTLKLEMPNVTTMGGGALHDMSNLPSAIDVGEFVPKSIAKISQRAITSCASLTGTLTLTNLTEVTQGIDALAVCFQTGITGGDFAGPIESMWWGWAGSGLDWTHVALNCPNLTNIVDWAFWFNGTAGVPLELKIYGPVNRKSGYPWTQELVDNILNSVAAVTDVSAMKMTFYCSRKQGWADFSGCRKMTAEEKAKAPADCFGIYTNAAGAIKAWMVHLPQDTDPSGMCIIIR